MPRKTVTPVPSPTGWYEIKDEEEYIPMLWDIKVRGGLVDLLKELRARVLDLERRGA